MVVETNVWKLLLLVGLVTTIVMSMCWSAPRRAVLRSELHRLIFCGVSLYAVGGFALLEHRHSLAGLVFAAGIVTCALAVWLSRGTDAEDPGPGDEPAEEPPPPGPDGSTGIVWDEFERAFRAYAERAPAGTA